METKPSKIGKYDVVSTLGQGAMGIVYKAFDPMIKRFVALKTIHLNLLQTDDDDISQRFRREAQAAGNLNHPHIVSIYEYGEEAERAYIAMEYVQGRTLTEMLKQFHPFTLAEIHSILNRVLDALDYSHRMGVIHRDVKPGNIMLSDTGTVKVMDFGIARIESSNLTRAGTILGTPGYMSPEQLKGESVDLRTDLYSAGIVLYELLTGEKAYSGSTFASVVYKVVHQKLVPPSRLSTRIPGSLDSLVLKACAKQAGSRYRSAREFSAALDQVLARQPEEHRTAHSAPLPSGPEPTTVVSRAVRTVRGKKWWGMAATLLAAGAGIVLTIWFMLPSERESAGRKALSPGTVFTDCETCPEMVVIPAGTFMQGTSGTSRIPEADEGSGRSIAIDDELAVGRYEITKAQFARFAAQNGYEAAGCNIYDGAWEPDPDRSWRSPGFEQDESHPVTCVSWNDAQAYVRWLSEQTGHRYRLLSASEWQHAALAKGDPSEGEKNDSSAACESGNVADLTTTATYPGWEIFNCRDDYVYTAPVGSFQANDFGLHDMIGNVFEWVADCWHENKQKSLADGAARMNGECGLHVLIGGSWFTPPDYVRASFHNRFDPAYRSSAFGFRVARENR